VVDCQTERYQARNKELAMRVLRSKLFALKEKDRENLKKELKGEHKNAGWGNQIRNYVLHPYKQVKDLRSKYETSDVEGVLDGKLDELIKAYLESTLAH
jgi:peptide chain release factor 2